MRHTTPSGADVTAWTLSVWVSVKPGVQFRLHPASAPRTRVQRSPGQLTRTAINRADPLPAAECWPAFVMLLLIGLAFAYGLLPFLYSTGLYVSSTPMGFG